MGKRQRVSRDKKIIQLSKIFSVSLDYLLNQDSTVNSKPRVTESPGCYVSSETAMGFLMFQKNWYMKAALSAGIIIGGTAFSFIPSGEGMAGILGYLISLIAGIAIIVSLAITPNTYRHLKIGTLDFDNDFLKDLNIEYLRMLNISKIFIISGVILCGVSLFILPMLEVPNQGNNILFIFSMAGTGISAFVLIYFTGILHSYKILLKASNQSI